MSWSKQQNEALSAVARWLADSTAPQIFRLFGFAGTGKTTIAKEIAKSVKGHVMFGAFTGKAALVLQMKGCHNASTIHSMIYKVAEDKDTRKPVFMLNPDSDASTAKLIIIDECSMVDEQLARDLLSFKARVLVLGDPAQLPPVKGTGFFINAAPDLMLTEVHRQAADNPIIRMSMDVREGRRLQAGRYGDSAVIQRASVEREQMAQSVMQADQVLVGINRTRRTYNARIRELKGIAEQGDFVPRAGDRLICLKNKKDKGLLNGSLWDVTARTSKALQILDLRVRSADIPGLPDVDVSVPFEFFDGTEDKIDWKFRRNFEEFDYGYAITVHKSQGSQWDNVIVFDESHAFRDDGHKHLYTAITRAANRVTVIV